VRTYRGRGLRGGGRGEIGQLVGRGGGGKRGRCGAKRRQEKEEEEEEEEEDRMVRTFGIRMDPECTEWSETSVRGGWGPAVILMRPMAMAYGLWAA